MGGKLHLNVKLIFLSFTEPGPHTGSDIYFFFYFKPQIHDNNFQNK